MHVLKSHWFKDLKAQFLLSKDSPDSRGLLLPGRSLSHSASLSGRIVATGILRRIRAEQVHCEATSHEKRCS